MLTKLFSPALLDTVFDRAADSLPCPPAADRAFWESLAERPPRNAWKEELLHRAEAAVAAPETLWPQLRAFQAFRFVRDGNRTDYETIYFQRRFHFSLLVLAECLEYRGRFLPEVVEGLWALLSEPFWYVPAHAHYRLPDPMPRYDSPQIDLFAAETAMLLADAVRLLGPELEAVSPELLRWIREEVRCRVFAPLEREGEDAPWWFAGRNNWTPWCSANTLGALFTFEEDRQKQLRIGRKLLEANDRFLATYAEDGGCDEGPGYYQVAAVQLMLFLEPLDRLSGGALRELWNSTKLRNMSEYIVRVHLDGKWFASPSDSSAMCSDYCNAGLLNRFGALTGSPLLREFAAAALRGFVPGGKPLEAAGNNHRPLLHNLLCNLLWMPEAEGGTAIHHPALTRLDNLEFFVLRAAGSVATLKGGHNDESHNHLDVGEFELFRNGQPVIVDPGCRNYTRQTFTQERYRDWCCGFEGHNPPIFDAYGEIPGREAAAHGSTASESPLRAETEIAGAYPEAAGVRNLRRTLTLAPDGTATIADTVELAEKRRLRLALYTPEEPIREAEEFRIGNMRLSLRGIQQCEIERIDLDDPKLRRNWGDHLWKLRLSAELPAGRSEWRLCFTPADAESL